jgi:serine phosphatase RsbU (regulator of sigma subunit)/pSer/pThr/pTyr-binding forkhead associated (FHA) protein
MAVLHILKGANQGQRVTLAQERITLGRNRDCTVIIDFPAVSRIHACIQRVQGQFFIEDGDGQGNLSRNGTFVNNQQITKPTLLKDQDRIKICDFLCTFHEDPMARPPGGEGDEGQADEEDASSTIVEARLGRLNNSQVLESQPAEKISALLDISTHLSKTLELDALLPRIADSLFQIYKQADRCFLIQREPRDDPAGKLVPKLIKTRRAATEASARFSRTIAKSCLETSQAFLSEDASTDSRFGLAQSIADFRIRSVMVAPLCAADGKTFGVIQLDTQDRSKKFTQDDLKLLIGVANQAAVALENVQLHRNALIQERHQRDLELAREVQKSFLPQKPPAVAGYQFFSHYESAQEIGGDYYDFIPLPGGQQLGIMLGDVAGKGVAAALLMAKLSAEARYCMLSEGNVAVSISKLNDLLMRAGLLDKFVTLAAVVLDPAKHTVTIVNAGHQTPLLYRPAAGTLQDAVDGELSGLPLGVMEGYQYQAAQAPLRPGDCILAFTDGITDAQNAQGERFEMKGVREALAAGKPHTGAPLTPAVVGERLVKAVKQHAAGRSQYDDIALVCFGRMQ